jgi:hypothetical protein
MFVDDALPDFLTVLDCAEGFGCFRLFLLINACELA